MYGMLRALAQPADTREQAVNCAWVRGLGEVLAR